MNHGAPTKNIPEKIIGTPCGKTSRRIGVQSQTRLSCHTITMAKRGRRVSFHGAFSSKAAARRKEQHTSRSYIRRARIAGQTRWLVLTRRSRG